MASVFRNPVCTIYLGLALPMIDIGIATASAIRARWCTHGEKKHVVNSESTTHTSYANHMRKRTEDGPGEHTQS